MKKLLFSFLLLPLYVFSQTTTVNNNDNVYPDTVWQDLTDLKTYGWSSSKLSNLKKFIIDSSHTTGMLVIQHGKILLQYGDIEEISYLASCRKSVLSILYGPFVKNGTINLNNTVEQLGLDDIGGLLPIEKKATIKDLLTARSGVYHAATMKETLRPLLPQSHMININLTRPILVLKS